MWIPRQMQLSGNIPYQAWYFLFLLNHFWSTPCDASCQFPTSVAVNPEADFIIGVLLPLRNSSSYAAFFECGSAVSERAVQVYEALRWTTSILNQKHQVLGANTEDAFIPGTKFGLRAFDSCGQDALAQLHLQQLFPELRWPSESLECVATSTGPPLAPRDNILGVIDLTEVTLKTKIKTRLRQLHIPTIPLDLETSIPAVEKAKAMIQLARKLGWQWASLVYSSDDYSTRGAVALGRMATEINLCLGVVERLPHEQDMQQVSKSNYKKAIMRISSEAPPNGGVFVFVRGHSLTAMVNLIFLEWATANRTKPLQWFFSEVVRVDRRDEDGGQSLPVYSLLPLPANVTGFETYWNNLSMSDLPDDDQNRWFSEYALQEGVRSECFGGKKVKCQASTTGQRVDRAMRNTFALSAVHAALTLAHSTKRAWRAKCANEAGLCRNLRRMSRAQFVETFFEPLELVHEESFVNLGVQRNVEDGKMSPSVRLALSVQQGSNVTQVLVYSENGIEMLDKDFRGTASTCPDVKTCKKCIRVRESRLEQHSEFLTKPPKSSSVTEKRLTIPLLLPLHGSTATSGSVRCNDVANIFTNAILEEVQKELQWATTSDGHIVEMIVLDTCSSTVTAVEALSQYLKLEDSDFGDDHLRRWPLAIVTGSSEEVSAVTSMLIPLNYTVLNIGPSIASKSLLLQMMPSPVLMAEAMSKVLSGLGRQEVVVIRDQGTLTQWELQMLEAVRDSNLCIVEEMHLPRDNTTLSSFSRKLISDLKGQGLSTVILLTPFINALLKSLKQAGGSQLTIVDLSGTTVQNPADFYGALSSLISLRPQSWRMVKTDDAFCIGQTTCVDDASGQLSRAKTGSNVVVQGLRKMTSGSLAPADFHNLIRSVTLDESGFSFAEDNYSLWTIDVLQHQFRANSSSPDLAKIGTYKDGVLTLLTPASTQGTSASASVCTKANSRTATARHDTSTTTLPIYDTDLAIAATFSVHKGSLGHCGPLRSETSIAAVEAFLWAIDQVNQQTDTLPGVRLGAVTFDTCGDRLRAARLLSEVLEEDRTFNISSLGAFIAASESNDQSTVLELLGSASVPTVSLRTPVSLSNGLPSFIVSTASPNALVVKALLSIFQYFEWTSVTLIYSNDQMHNGDIAATLLQEAPSRDIRISELQLEPFEHSSDGQDNQGQKAVQHLVKSRQNGARVTVALLEGEHMKSILELISRLEDKDSFKDMVWIMTGHERLFLKHRALTSGVLSLSLHQTGVPKFESYFSRLHITNNTRNPWFKELWQKVFNCEGSSCEDDRYNLRNYRLPEGSDRVSRIVQAVFQVARALESVRRHSCPENISGLCEAMKKTNGWRAEVPDAMREIQKMEEEDGRDLMTESRLDIYGFGKVGNDAFSFIKIGQFFNEQLTFDVSSNPDNDELLPFANVQSSCLSCKEDVIGKVRKPKRTEAQYFPSSNFQVLLLLPMHDRGHNAFRCGSLGATDHLQEALAFGLALESLRKDSTWRQTKLTLGGVVLDYCQEVTRARERLFGLLANEDSSVPSDSVVAALALDDRIAEVTAQTLSGTGIVTLSLSMPHLREPSVDVLHPDTTATDQLTAVVDLLLHFQWNHVAVLASNDDHSIALRRNFTRLTTVRDICVAGEFLAANDSLTDADAMKLLQDVRRTSGSRVIVVLTRAPDVLRSLLMAAEFTVSSEKLVFVLVNDQPVELWGEVSSHVLSVVMDYEEDPDFGDRWSALDPVNDQWLNREWTEELWLRQFNCQVSGTGGADRTHFPPACLGDERLTDQGSPPSAGHIRRAIMVIANALVNTIKHDCPKTLFTSLDDCASGSRAHFRQEVSNIWNEQVKGRLAILKYQKRAESGSERQHFQKIGTWSTGQLDIATVDQSLFGSVPKFRCSGKCADRCHQMALQSTASLDLSPRSATSNFRSIWGLITSALSGLGILLVIFCMVYFSVSIPGPSTIGHFLLSGLLLLYALNFAFILQPGEVVCGVRRFALGVAYAAIFSAKLVRVVSAWRRAYSYQRDTLLDPKPSPQSGLALLAALLLTLVQVGLTTAWLVFSPPRAVLPDFADQPALCFPTANFEEELVVSMAYVMLLMALTLFFGILSWSSLEDGRDARWVLLSSSLMSIVWIAWTVVVTHAPQPYRDPSVVISNLISATIVLVLLFARKIYMYSRMLQLSCAETPMGSSCGSSTYTAPSSYSSMAHSAVLGDDYSSDRRTFSGVSSHTRVTPLGAPPSGEMRSTLKKNRGQVQATDLYPLDVYDIRTTQYSSSSMGSRGRPKVMLKKKTDDYF